VLLLGNHLYIWLILVTLCHYLDKYLKKNNIYIFTISFIQKNWLYQKWIGSKVKYVERLPLVEEKEEI
jgi:hypothetical protein